MSKRVHFSPTNVVYAPTPSTPSPSLSFSSLPSSSSPEISTPPPDPEEFEPSVYPRTPYTTHAELFQEVGPPKHIQIHFSLAYHPMTESAVQYDISLPPEVLDGQLPPHIFAEPATSPPMSSILITHPHFNWYLKVVPASPLSGTYVSVEDVLVTIYRELRQPITRADYSTVPEGDAKLTIDATYFNRCAQVLDPILREKERAKGIKRIDFLMGRTRFLGLSGTHEGPDVWELNVS